MGNGSLLGRADMYHVIILVMGWDSSSGDGDVLEFWPVRRKFGELVEGTVGKVATIGLGKLFPC